MNKEFQQWKDTVLQINESNVVCKQKVIDHLKYVRNYPDFSPEEFVSAFIISSKYNSLYDLGYNLLSQTDKCGCYFCKKIFHPKEVSNEWCRASCPFCDIDSIIPDNPEYPLTKDLLELLNKVMF